jgi:O-antigen/teichoic acid export membrane protein
VVAIMFSEQTLMNAGVLVVAASAGGSITSGLAGFVFNVLLIVRAPLQLFQAIQTSILPHLAGLEARDSGAEFRHAVRVTILAIAAFASAVAIGLLAIGPFVMTTLLGNKGFTYDRFGLAAVGLGMGLHLTSGTLNQALLARGQARFAAGAWLLAALAFVLFVALHTIPSEVTRVEIGYLGATGLLAAMLWTLYSRDGASP